MSSRLGWQDFYLRRLLSEQSLSLFSGTLGYFGFLAVHHRCSLFTICCIVSLNSHRQSLHTARTCFRAVFTLSLSPLSPGRRKWNVFCLPVFTHPQRKAIGAPFFCYSLPAYTAGFVSVRRKAHPQNLSQPESPCS